MSRAQDGDRLAYEALLNEAAVLIRRFVGKRLRQAEHLEDVVQETLLAIHIYRDTYDPARPFCPWMYAIAWHRFVDFVGKERRRTEKEIQGGESLEELGSAHEAADHGGSLGFLRHALALLSQKQREVIQLLKLDGYSVAEVSMKTGLSEASVKVTAHRGYKSLRKLFAGPAREE
jgi:RNA polymerase sigma-70 factor (ECF subfamily)